MSTIKATTLSNLDGSKTVPTDTVVSGTAKAWVNFNGTGTVAIRVSFNVSSITDNGTGDYTVNFTTVMPDANYAIAWSSTHQATTNTNWYTDRIFYNRTSSSFRCFGGQGGGISDDEVVNAIVFR